MDDIITLDNLEEHSLPIDEHLYRWMFEDEKGFISEEHKAQIFPLKREAAMFLWNVESNFKIFRKDFFKDNIEWNMLGKSSSEIKKWLFNLGIPFSQKVFVSIQPDIGFVMTWKMVIKYAVMDKK